MPEGRFATFICVLLPDKVVVPTFCPKALYSTKVACKGSWLLINSWLVVGLGLTTIPSMVGGGGG